MHGRARPSRRRSRNFLPHAAFAGTPAFKTEGDAVAVGDTVGLIEVMKTFTPVVAEEAGTLVAFRIENEDAGRWPASRSTTWRR